MDLRDARSRDDPGRADRPRADADLDGVGAAPHEVPRSFLRRHVAGDDGSRRKALADQLQRVEHSLAVSVRGVEDEDVDLGAHELARAVEDVPGDADGGAHPQPPERVLRGVGVLDRLLDVLDRDEALEASGAVDDEELLDAVLVEELLGLIQCGADRRRDQVFLGHARGDGLVQPRLEAQVTVGQDADELAPLVDHRNARDLEAGHELQGLDDRLLGPARHGIDDHPGLGALDLVDFGRLGLDRKILVDHAEAARLGHGNREPRLRDRVHRRRDHGDVQTDVRGQAGREIDLAGMDFRVRRKEEDVVERQGQGDRVVGSGSGILRHHAPAAR